MTIVRGSSRGVLVVDDEESVLKATSRALRSHGFEKIWTCRDGSAIDPILKDHDVAVVLLDLRMPQVSGEEVLDRLGQSCPGLPVVVITAEDDVEAAVRCMKLGALDYLVKPVGGDKLASVVQQALDRGDLQYECDRLRERFFEGEGTVSESFDEIVTANAKMHRMFSYLDAIARGSHPVLIIGETGTGKELVARSLHRASQRNGPFVAVNVAGLDDTMFGDTLFGHVPGAFTGAQGTRSGMIEKAADGTLFLDEVGDLSEASQVKLLRLLQEHEYYPLGSDQPQHLRARVVTATHKDPRSLRMDLYYRLRAYQVTIPPLRERLDDLPLLVDHFMEVVSADLGKRKPTVPPELFLYLANHSFPGNIRELQSIVFEAVARHDQGVMPVQQFIDRIDVEAEPSESHQRDVEGIGFPFPMPRMDQIELAAAREALKRVEGNRSAASRMLGVSRPTMIRLAKKLEEPGDE